MRQERTIPQISRQLEQRSICRREKRLKLGRRKRRNLGVNLLWLSNAKWLEKKKNDELLDVEIHGRKLVVILPEKMNFSDKYEKTSVAIEAIRRFTKMPRMPKSCVSISRVDFSKLKKISTSAALVLTAEISRWEDITNTKLTANLDEWDPDVSNQLLQLGFFDLFEASDAPDNTEPYIDQDSRLLVRYVKARCDDPDAFLHLKDEIERLIGDVVEQWMFLHMGISEAITNVSHHAYPADKNIKSRDKNWYLSASYDQITHQLKIVFYDQGIGIPESLPASKLNEQVLEFVAKRGLATGRKDSILIQAAMEIARTRTGSTDRGKGLNDLVEFARKRENGYLSILSQYGLYKLTANTDGVKGFTFGFKNRIPGTLIIWSTRATEPA